MSATRLKQTIIETLAQLPDEDDAVEQAMEHVYFIAVVERGLDQSQAGQTIAHDDVKRRFIA
jgi:hypothetical protein